MLPGTPQTPEQHEHQSTENPLVAHLILSAAFAKELELQAHLIHLNYRGADFLPLHQFLKSQYQLHQEEFDTLAEFVLTLGSPMPHANAALRAALPHFDEPSSNSPDQLVALYSHNLAIYAEIARHLDAVSTQYRAIDVAHYAAQLLSAAHKAIWFLSASRT